MAKEVRRLVKELLISHADEMFRAELFSVSPQLSYLVISEQTAEQTEVKTTTKIPNVTKELIITPDLEGVSKEDLPKRTKQVQDYVKKHGVAKALEQVGNEVIKAEAQTIPLDATKEIQEKIKAANAALEDTVITWQPRIEKDLKFKVVKMVQDTPGFEEVENLSTETEYTYTKVKEWDLHFKVRPRDFTKHVQNYLNQK